jgi:RNA polymerase sigma factor (sigma-70 family)
MARLPGNSHHRSAPSTAFLLRRARAGDAHAVSALFRQHGHWLRQWARGRLPRWARAIHDTADIVQDALFQTFRRLDRFEDRGKGALRAYLRQAVENRIHDVMRAVARRPVDALDSGEMQLPAHGPSPFDQTAIAERERRYKMALDTLSEEERHLVVGRLELGFTYEQLALIANRPTPDAARVAVRRAVTKLAERMADMGASASRSLSKGS